MKNILSAIIILLTLASCSVSSDYTITGTIDGAIDGDSVTLGYSSDGNEFVTVSSTTIENGKFYFGGKTDGTGIYYIGYSQAIEPIYALFFLESGNITAEIASESCTITGTPSNDLNTKIERELANFVHKMYEYEFTLYSDTLMTDSARSQLALQAMEVQRDASIYIQNIIRENITSIVGAFQLVQYSELFDDKELFQLLDMIPEEMIDRDNNCLYDVLMQLKADRLQQQSDNEESIDEVLMRELESVKE